MYVELNHIQKRFGNYQASDDVSFGIEKGKLIGLLGPSGSGKTTILRMIAGLEHPDSGEIKIDGKVVNDIPASKRGIGFVFQNYALFRYMTVYDNIAFGLKVQKADRKTIHSRVMELVDLIGLRGLERSTVIPRLRLRQLSSDILPCWQTIRSITPSNIWTAWKRQSSARNFSRSPRKTRCRNTAVPHPRAWWSVLRSVATGSSVCDRGREMLSVGEPVSPGRFCIYLIFVVNT